jgi:ATP phosphoribosyltransferase regulatory subunit
MSDDVPNHPALLPAGLRDLLPPEAETEAASVEALMEVFAAHGYQRVKPPLLEFEDSLLAGSGAAVAEQIFRLMDSESQRMMGLRADTTPQVARIATTRLPPLDPARDSMPPVGLHRHVASTGRPALHP